MFEVTPNEITYFEFKCDGDVYSVPHMRFMPMSQLLEYNRARKNAAPGMESDLYLDMVARIFEEHAPGVVGKLTADQFRELSQAYFAESRVSPGESSASSD